MKAKKRSAKRAGQSSVESAATSGDTPPPSVENGVAPPSSQDSRVPENSAATEDASALHEASASSRLSRRRRLLFLTVPYVLLIALLVALEIVTRLALPHVSTLEAWVQSPEQQFGFTDREHMTIFEGDPTLFWRLKPNLQHVIWDFTMVSTNSEHVRHEGDLAPKSPGSIRVLCLGDSVTFGYRVPVVWPERPNDYARDWLPYPMLVERRLREANPGRQIEVVALAVPGYTSFQGLAWLRRDIEELQPDVVTACFGWNDVGMRAQTDSQTMHTEWTQVALRRAMSYSQALIYASKWVQSKRDAGSSNPGGNAVSVGGVPRVLPEEYVRNLLEIARVTKEHGAAPLIIGSVYRDRKHDPAEANLMESYRASVREAAAGAGVHYLEIPELTEAGFPANENLFGEPIHPNHEGHRLMASALLKFFAEQHLLKGINVPPSL